MKKCKFCAEEIQDEAIICRYCGKKLNGMGKPAVIAIGVAMIMFGCTLSYSPEMNLQGVIINAVFNAAFYGVIVLLIGKGIAKLTKKKQ